MAPLILIENGYGKWTILEPSYAYGNHIDGREDRRYKVACSIDGSLADATERLHQLERGRQP